jgi:hypothetical protein
MALIPRVKVKADIEHPALASVLADLEPFAARFGVGVGWNMTTADAHTADRLFDVTVAHLRRANLPQPIVVHRHNCPHVAGFEEPTWTACTHPQYGYQETVI